MKRQQFLFRPNPNSKLHQQAWKYLKAVPSGQKNAYLVQAILEFESKKELESTLRRILEDSGRAGTKETSPVSVPQEVLDFLGGLMEEQEE